MLREEIEIQEMCKHKHLLGLYQIYEDSTKIYLVMKLMKGGTLKQLRKYENNADYHLVVRGVIHQVAMALYYLKTFSIIHRDIKGENILLTGKSYSYYDFSSKRNYSVPEVKVADFGLSTILSW